MLKEICGTETDYGWVYDNFEDLAKDRPDTAKEMLTHIAKGDWQDMEIHYYANTYDFASKQIGEGWYASILGHNLWETDYHGAPNLASWIDLTNLGLALVNTGDPTVLYLTSKNEVIETTDGFQRIYPDEEK